MWNPLIGDPVVGPFLHTIGLGFIFPVLFVFLGIWAFAWKGAGLWYAARNRQRWWVIAFLLIHSVGILEIIYLKWYQKDENGKGSSELFPFLKDWKARARDAVSHPEPKPAE